MFTLNLYCHLRYCLQLLCPVYLFCCLHMLSFSQCEDFSTHYCTIVYIKCLHCIFTVTHGTVYNYSPQYTGFAVYICFPFHNAIFFLIYCTIHSTTMSIAYPQHIHTVLFTITLPSILILLLTYAFLFTMWIFFNTLLYNCIYKMFTLNLYCNLRYCLQLLCPV